MGRLTPAERMRLAKQAVAGGSTGLTKTGMPSGRPIVLKLNKSLYGFKLAGREWNKLLVSKLEQYGFRASTIDISHLPRPLQQRQPLDDAACMGG